MGLKVRERHRERQRVLPRRMVRCLESLVTLDELPYPVTPKWITWIAAIQSSCNGLQQVSANNGISCNRWPISAHHLPLGHAPESIATLSSRHTMHLSTHTLSGLALAAVVTVLT